jgi:uncharacterized protein with beta-barrel porin domain
MVGKESQSTFTVTNNSTVAIGFRGANFRGAHAADFFASNNCPATIQSGQACQFNIVFRPTAAGARTALMDLVDDNGAPNTVITINGPGAVAAITPTQAIQAASQQIVANLKSIFTGIQTQLINVSRRMRYLRFQDSTPGFQQEIDVAVNGKNVPLSGGTDAQAGGGGGCGSSGTNGASSNNQNCKDDYRGTRNERWGSYITGSVGVSENTLNGAKINTNGLTVGADYRLSGKSAVGVAFGTMKSDTNMTGNTDKQEANGYSFVAYGSFAPSQSTYIDVALTKGNNKFDLQRAETTGATAVANTDGNGLGLSLTAGYDWRSGGWVFTPYGRAEYVNSKVKAFVERGADPIQVGDQSMTSKLMTFGAEVQYTASTSWGIFVPHVRVEMQKESQSSPDATAQVVGSFTQLTVTPDLNKDKSFGNTAIGASAQFGKGKTGFLDFEKTFGKENIKDQRITTGFKVEF